MTKDIPIIEQIEQEIMALEDKNKLADVTHYENRYGLTVITDTKNPKAWISGKSVSVKDRR